MKVVSHILDSQDIGTRSLTKFQIIPSYFEVYVAIMKYIDKRTGRMN